MVNTKFVNPIEKLLDLQWLDFFRGAGSGKCAHREPVVVLLNRAPRGLLNIVAKEVKILTAEHRRDQQKFA
jgi:tRNA(Ile)-lysidine synthase TilS/MesJ